MFYKVSRKKEKKERMGVNCFLDVVDEAADKRLAKFVVSSHVR